MIVRLERALRVLVFLAPIAAAAGQGTEPSVRYGVTKSRDTVTVGEPFEVRVRIRVPADAQITFPDNPDTAGTVQARDPRTIETADSVQSLDETAIYRLAAWDVDTQAVRLGDAIVTWNGVERRVPIGEVTVFVRSVLPADSALRVPKPARPIWEAQPFPWWILAALAAALAIALGVWWWMRRRRRPKPAIVVDPYARALKEMRRIEAMGLIDAGERTRFIALLVEVVRDYLAARYPDASLALTSRELVGSLRGHQAVPREQLARVLHEADLAKFAAWAIAEDRARGLARDVRAIIEHEHKASRPVVSDKAAA